MVSARIGDLFDTDAQTLVNTVNCVGVMGKGVALEFKKRFPDMFADYKKRCDRKQLHLGEPYLYKYTVPPWVLNFPTKDHWRAVSRLDAIVAGLRYLEAHYQEWGISSLAVPPLGCGHGQLEWRVVGPTLYRHLSHLQIPVILFAPFGTPESELDEEFLAGQSPSSPATGSTSEETKIPPAWVALVAVVKKIEQEPFHWPIGRTTFQKIAYFATAEGLPTGLEYGRGSYRPFSSGVTPMLSKLVNNGLIREERLGRMLAIHPGPTFGDALRRFREEIEKWGPMLRRVTDLFLRMQTKDAEVAATVLHAAREMTEQRAEAPMETEVLEEVKRWKQHRKPPIDESEVASAIRHLNLLGWVQLKPSEDLPVPSEVF